MQDDTWCPENDGAYQAEMAERWRQREQSAKIREDGLKMQLQDSEAKRAQLWNALHGLLEAQDGGPESERKIKAARTTLYETQFCGIHSHLVERAQKCIRELERLGAMKMSLPPQPDDRLRAAAVLRDLLYLIKAR